MPSCRADNMMGRIKFMMPNRPGIYLHDTPLKAAFRKQDRRLSSGVGCVRVEDAPRLARWLFGGSLPRSNSRAEQRIDLAEPIPVYTLCLTAIPLSQRPFRPGIYLRDKPENEFRLGTRHRELTPTELRKRDRSHYMLDGR